MGHERQEDNARLSPGQSTPAELAMLIWAPGASPAGPGPPSPSAEEILDLKSCVLGPALPHPSRASLGKSLNLTELQFPNL